MNPIEGITFAVEVEKEGNPQGNLETDQHNSFIMSSSELWNGKFMRNPLSTINYSWWECTSTGLFNRPIVLVANEYEYSKFRQQSRVNNMVKAMYERHTGIHFSFNDSLCLVFNTEQGRLDLAKSKRLSSQNESLLKELMENPKLLFSQVSPTDQNAYARYRNISGIDKFVSNHIEIGQAARDILPKDVYVQLVQNNEESENPLQIPSHLLTSVVTEPDILSFSSLAYIAKILSSEVESNRLILKMPESGGGIGQFLIDTNDPAKSIVAVLGEHKKIFSKLIHGRDIEIIYTTYLKITDLEDIERTLMPVFKTMKRDEKYWFDIEVTFLDGEKHKQPMFIGNIENWDAIDPVLFSLDPTKVKGWSLEVYRSTEVLKEQMERVLVQRYAEVEENGGLPPRVGVIMNLKDGIPTPLYASQQMYSDEDKRFFTASIFDPNVSSNVINNLGEVELKNLAQLFINQGYTNGPLGFDFIRTEGEYRGIFDHAPRMTGSADSYLMYHYLTEKHGLKIDRIASLGVEAINVEIFQQCLEELEKKDFLFNPKKNVNKGILLLPIHYREDLRENYHAFRIFAVNFSDIDEMSQWYGENEFFV